MWSHEWGEDRNVFTTSHDDDRMYKYCGFIVDNTLIFVFHCSWRLQHVWVVLCCECQLHQKYTDTQMSNIPKSTLTPKYPIHPKVHWHPNVQCTQKYTNTQMSLHPKVHWHPNVQYTQKYTNTQMSLHPKVH
jgi:hypothetical protein